MELKVNCGTRHEIGDVALTLALLFGIIVSYLPQHLKIIHLGSVEGISPAYLLLGSLASLSSLFNVLLLQVPFVQCCWSVGRMQCLANLLGILQMVVQWCMFFLIFALYCWKKPVARSVAEENLLLSSMGLESELERTVLAYALVLSVLSLATCFVWGWPSPASVFLASILGIISLLLNVLQFLPQIHATYRRKHVGALSVPAMCMQAPGSLVFSYTLSRSPGTNASTWASYAVGGILQGTLLGLCIYYRRRKHAYLVLPEDAVEG